MYMYNLYKYILNTHFIYKLDIFSEKKYIQIGLGIFVYIPSICLFPGVSFS